jgi:hypothetical protein
MATFGKSRFQPFRLSSSGSLDGIVNVRNGRWFYWLAEAAAVCWAMWIYLSIVYLDG